MRLLDGEYLASRSFPDSPVLRRVAATRYLERFAPKRKLGRSWKDFDAYLRAAFLNPQAIRSPLAEEDFRIIAMMDFEKRRRAARLADCPQDHLVTVLMPTKNRAHMIETAIRSVLAQSYRNFELLVIDDGGEDGTETVVRRFGDDRIRFLRNSYSMGPAGARNVAMQTARGSFVANLDDDDMWDPDFLLLSVNELIESGLDLCYSAQLVWSGYDEHTGLGRDVRMVRFAPFNRSLLENTNYISQISCMHTRDLFDRLQGYDTTLKRLVDWDFFLRATEDRAPSAIPCILSHYFYRRDPVNVTASVDPHEAEGAIGARMACRSSWSGAFPFDSGVLVDVTGRGEAALRARAAAVKGAAGRTTIVVPSYEARQEIEVCLDMIACVTEGDYRVLVVDNASGSNAKYALRRLEQRFDKVKVVDYDERPGFTHAVNAGLAMVGRDSEFVVIMNNDTIPTPGWLDELAVLFRQYPDCGMAVPRQVLPAGHAIGKAHVPFAVKTREVDVNLSAHHQNVLDPFFDVERGVVELNFAPLFCAMLRSEDVRALGFLDADNGAHFRSDWILCNDVRRLLKKRILYTQHSKVYHLQGVSTAAKAGAAA